jgi:hypothetical protein
VREIFLEELARDEPTILGEFADSNGSSIVTVQPSGLSKEGIPRGWELRIVDTSSKRVLANRMLDVPPISECTFRGALFYDPKLEMVSNGAGGELLFHVCGRTEFLNANDLKTHEVIPRIRGRVLRTGKWAIAIGRREKGIISGTLLNLQSGEDECRFEVNSPTGMEAELGEVLLPHNEHLFGVLMHYGTRPEGRGLYIQAVGLQVHKRANCETLSSHLFPGQVGQGPDTPARFAGPESQWVVSGPAVKTEKDGPLSVWDWRTGKKVVELRYKGGTANVLDVSPDGRYVAVATGDEYSKRSVRDFVIWDLEAQRVAYESAKYSPRLKRSEYEKVVMGKDGRPAKIRAVLPFNLASFSSDGKRLLHITGHRIAVYEITGKK